MYFTWPHLKMSYKEYNGKNQLNTHSSLHFEIDPRCHDSCSSQERARSPNL